MNWSRGLNRLHNQVMSSLTCVYSCRGSNWSYPQVLVEGFCELDPQIQNFNWVSLTKTLVSKIAR